MSSLSEFSKLSIPELIKAKEKIEYLLSAKEKQQKNCKIKPSKTSTPFLGYFYKIVIAMLKLHTATPYPNVVDMLKSNPRTYNDFVETHESVERYLLNLLDHPKFEERLGFYSIACMSIQKYMAKYNVPFSLAAFINCKEKFPMILERELPYLSEDKHFLATILKKGNQIKF